MTFQPLPLAATAPHRRSTRFIVIFALANVGGVIGYLPLLTLLLPIKVEEIAGEARFGLFAATVVAGAIAASVANIAFGGLSDRTLARGGGRRGWVTAGMIATTASYALVVAAASPAPIIVSIALFQVSINALLAPLLAIMADEIPDAQKGVAGGWLALGNPIASALSAVLVGLTLIGEAGRLGLVAAAIVACILPLLWTRAQPVTTRDAPRGAVAMPRRDLALAWVARLAVQVAGNVLSLYLLYYFERLDGARLDPMLPAHVGRLLTIAYVIPLPVALVFGRWSDRLARRKPFLLTATVIAASGLLAMAAAQNWRTSAIGFSVYAIGSAVFLALHSGFAAQLLPDPAHRGRDLGIVNLTNTLPALIGTMLAWRLATPHDFTALMLVLAALTLGGGLAILAVSGRR